MFFIQKSRTFGESYTNSIPAPGSNEGRSESPCCCSSLVTANSTEKVAPPTDTVGATVTDGPDGVADGPGLGVAVAVTRDAAGVTGRGGVAVAGRTVAVARRAVAVGTGSGESVGTGLAVAVGDGVSGAGVAVSTAGVTVAPALSPQPTANRMTNRPNATQIARGATGRLPNSTPR